MTTVVRMFIRGSRLVAVTLVLTGCVALAWFPACTGSELEETPPAEEAGTTPPAPGKDIGVPCAAGAECGTGICRDGVCCNAACDGVCESCSLPGSIGQCTPIPAGQDPEKECAAQPPIGSDAGASDPDAGTDGGDGGTSPVFQLPDGGITRNDGPCAGSCNGARACAYPDESKSCGSTFCGTSTQVGKVTCDGRGNCATVAVETCSAYTCEPSDTSGACRTSCAAPSDCQPSHYCSGQGKCEPKKENGQDCALATECKTGFCNGAAKTVCCNTECTGTGFRCDDAANLGKCLCPACPNGGACKLYYRDADGDGFGDKEGTLGNGNATYGCEAGPAPGTGIKPDKWVTDNTDCYDVDDAQGAKVHPGAGFQTEGYGPGATNFDYDCNGSIQMQYVEAPNGCKFCDYENVNGNLTCLPHNLCAASETNVVAGHTCGSTSPVGGIQCKPINPVAFQKIVGCGGTANLIQCGKCSGTNTLPTATLLQFNAKQGCR